MPSVAELFETMDYGPAPEGPGPALGWIRGRSPFGLYIGGKWREPYSANQFETVNPATGTSLASISHAGAEDVDAAVTAARNAQDGWWEVGGHARARYLYAMARQIQKHSRLLSVLETLDNGKPIREARDIDIPLAARHFYHHAGWAQLMKSQMRGFEPVGVAGQIIPWNFPLLMLAWKVAPAIAMGNTIVLKPAEQTPLTAMWFAEMCIDIGLPQGVVNIITGDGSTGDLIVRHPGVDKIAFTGSTEVGRGIRRATAGTAKKLSLELGGKSPFIVFEDADLDSAVEGIVDAIWFNQGEVCCAGSRLLVQEGIADRFHHKLRDRMETLRVGDPLDKCTDIGAIISTDQLEKIRRLVREAADDGSMLWQPSGTVPANGCYYPPTLFTNVSPAAEIAREEVFGPVLVSMTFRTPAEAIELANNTRYGLAASVWTENINLALEIAPKIKAGTVWVNSTNLFDAASGFGGYRESGFGREGGREGLYEYVKRERSATEAACPAKALPAPSRSAAAGNLPRIDRTAKLYIAGKQTRPDSGYSRNVLDHAGRKIGEVGVGNRKDVRNAVEAAQTASRGWSRSSGHNRAQILYYIAENLAARASEFAVRVGQLTGCTAPDSSREVDAAQERLFEWAAWSDKYDGAVHHTPIRNVTIAMPEALGVVGIACPDEAPLLAFVTLLGGAIALGNTVVIIPSERYPLCATDFIQVLETSDLPGGVANIVTGSRSSLVETLAAHDDVQSIWSFSGSDTAAVHLASAGNLKRTWTPEPGTVDWYSGFDAEEVLREATQVKNIWIPYGE